MLSLYKLEIFATVVAEGSFSAAAHRLYMTQPAVSQHIQDLESGLGTRLFDRGRRGVTLTKAGETLYDYTQRILNLVIEAESAVTSVQNISAGQISIGATPGVSVYMMPEWTRSFREQFPNLTTGLMTDITSAIVDAVATERIDIGIVEGELHSLNNPSIQSTGLRDIALYVIVGKGHPWCQQEQISIDALNGQPFITRQPNSQTRIWIDGVLTRHGVRPRIVAEFDNPESIKHAVMSNMGVTILPDYAVKREIEAGMVRALALTNLPLVRQLKLIHKKGRPFSAVTRAFLRHIQHELPSIRPLLEP